MTVTEYCQKGYKNGMERREKKAIGMRRRKKGRELSGEFERGAVGVCAGGKMLLAVGASALLSPEPRILTAHSLLSMYYCSTTVHSSSTLASRHS